MKHRAIVIVSPQLLIDALKEGEQRAVEVINPLPADATVVDVLYKRGVDQFAIELESAAFAPSVKPPVLPLPQCRVVVAEPESGEVDSY